MHINILSSLVVEDICHYKKDKEWILIEECENKPYV